MTAAPTEAAEPGKRKPESPSQAPRQTTEALPPAEETPLYTPPAPTPKTQQPTPNAAKFTTLISKIYDRDYDLGSCFERNISFVNFEGDKLTWESTAEGEEKKLLIKHWGLINMFVKELFGFETKIVNIAKKKAVTEDREQSVGSSEQEPGSREQVAENTEQGTGSIPRQMDGAHADADSGSMIEELEMKSSCIAPDAGETEAAKEKDPSVLLEEPMVKTALDLFNPKKVRIKRNV